MKTNSEFYDQLADKNVEKFVGGNPRVHEAWRAIKQTVGNACLTPQSIVDFGCGIGETSWRCSLNWPNAQVCGIDGSAEAISTAQKLFKHKQLNFANGDLSELKNCDSCDLLLMVDVIEHIDPADREAFFKTVNTILTENGLVFLAFPSPQYQQYLRENKPNMIQPVDEDITLEVLLRMGQKTGTNLLRYEHKSIWKQNDYIHAVFTKGDVFASQKSMATEKRSLLSRLLRRLNLKILSNDLPDNKKLRKRIVQASVAE